MCRLTIYKGRPILIGDLVTKPENSLLFQSRHAAYHPGVVDQTHQRNILVNGDGFGVAWYTDNGPKGSCCFKFVTPAWSNGNLRNIGDHVSSHLIFAHIRAASSGHDPHEKTSVSNENCHPFKFGKYTFVHNGGIPGFNRIKRQLLNLLSEEVYLEIKGSTDSEHMFALFLDYVLPLDAVQESKCPDSEADLAHMVTALSKMMSTFVNLCTNAGILAPCSINLCVSDGVHVIATRFRNGPQNPPSLYYNFGSGFVCEDGNFYSSNNEITADSIVISSAPLSKVRRCKVLDNKHDKLLECSSVADAERAMNIKSDREFSTSQTNEAHNGSWVLMPKDHMLICRGDPANPHKVLSIRLDPIVITAVTSPPPSPLSQITTNQSGGSVCSSVSSASSSERDNANNRGGVCRMCKCKSGQIKNGVRRMMGGIASSERHQNDGIVHFEPLNESFVSSSGGGGDKSYSSGRGQGSKTSPVRFRPHLVKLRSRL